MDQTKAFSFSNITKSPGSTIAGVAWLMGIVAPQLSNGWPSNGAGWMQLAFNTGAAVLMATAKG